MSKRLSVIWLYTFVAIAVAALVVGLFALNYKEYLIVIAMGMVFVAQIISIIRWKRN